MDTITTIHQSSGNNRSMLTGVLAILFPTILMRIDDQRSQEWAVSYCRIMV